MDKDNLFRKEAISARSSRVDGKIVFSKHPSYSWMLFGFALFFLICILFLLAAHYSSYELVRGRLISNKGIYKIYPPANAVIQEVHIKQGQPVKIGDKLISLRQDSRTLEGNSANEKIKQEVESQILNLQLLREKTSKLGLNKVLITKESVGKLKSRIKHLVEKNKISNERIDLANEIHKKQLTLIETGGVSSLDISSSKAEYLRLKELNLDQKSLIIELEEKLALLESQLETIPEETKSKLIEIDNSISNLTEQVVNLNEEIVVTVESRYAGSITNIVGKLGESVNADYPLLTIVPDDSEIQAELYIPTRAAGFIAKGQLVRMRIDAFPSQYYGHVEGEIVDLSSAFLLPDEWQNPYSIDEPIYKATVQLRSTSLSTGLVVNLEAGLSVDADIVLEKLPLFDYLISPIWEISSKFK